MDCLHCIAGQFSNVIKCVLTADELLYRGQLKLSKRKKWQLCSLFYSLFLFKYIYNNTRKFIIVGGIFSASSGELKTSLSDIIPLPPITMSCTLESE